MTQFKETVAFEDLRTIIGNEIAGVFLARLKEFSVPDDRLRQLSEDICYDIASAMNTVGDFEIPGADQLCDMQEEITDKVDQPEPGANDLAFMEESTDKVDQSEPDANELVFFEEKTDKVDLMDVDSDDQPTHPVKGVLSQNEILKILNAAKAAPV